MYLLPGGGLHPAPDQGSCSRFRGFEGVGFHIETHDLWTQFKENYYTEQSSLGIFK